MKIFLWTVALCAGLIVWLYVDIESSLKIDYNYNSFLINATTNETMLPMDVIDLKRVIYLKDDYVNRTNAVERLFDLGQQTNFENIFPVSNVYSNKEQLEQSGWPVANQTQCSAELDWIGEQLTTRAHNDYMLLKGKLGLELTQLMDSYGKPESSFYSGVFFWPGSYEQCMRTSLNDGKIRTRYCIAHYRLKWWPAREPSNPKTRLRIAICIPETCDTLSFETQRDKIDLLVKNDMNQLMRENLELDSMLCLPDERSPFRKMPPSGCIFLAFIATWLTLVLIATLLHDKLNSWQTSGLHGPANRRDDTLKSASDNFKNLNELSDKENKAAYSSLLTSGLAKQTPKDDLETGTYNELNTSTRTVRSRMPILYSMIRAFSIQQSWASFKSNPFEDVKQLALRENRQIRVDLAWLNFFKFSMALTIVLAHSYVMISFASTNLSHRINLNVGPFFGVGANLPKLVDVFFTFSGVLASYTMLRKFNIEQLSNPLNWFTINLGILIRVSPVFLIVYYYAKTISSYTGAGPWWDYGIYQYSPKGICMNEPWWRAILYVANTGQFQAPMCIPSAWFLADLVQIALVLPLITYLLYKMPKHLMKYLLLAFITIISCAQMIVKMKLQVSFKGEIFGSYGMFLISLLDKFEHTGTRSTLGRLSCVTYGCYTGYLLHLYHIGKIRKWPRWLRSDIIAGLVFIAHFVVLFAPAFLMMLLRQVEHETDINEFLISFLGLMIIWPIMNGILIINFSTVNNRSRIVRFLSRPIWHRANKIGFCLFLVHWEVLGILLLGHPQGPSVGLMADVLRLASYGLIISLLISFLILILFDTPISTLLSLLAQRAQKRVNAPKLAETEPFRETINNH